MTFATYEESRESGNPIQLFKFVYGSEAAEYFAYTDHTEEKTVSAITYSPVDIARDAIESNGTLDKSAIKISTDISTGLAELFRVYPPSSVVVLTIFAGHIGDADDEFLAIWVGRIVSAARKGSTLEMTGEPVSTSLRRPGLRRPYMYGCPHELYGPHCLADKPSKTVASTVDSIDGATVTLAAGWEGAFAAEKFLHGMLEWTNPGGSTNRRTILRVSGDVLSLSGLPTDLAATDAVDVVLGCNHKPFAESGGDCQGLHDNILNYGGDPFIPATNPIGQRNHFF